MAAPTEWRPQTLRDPESPEQYFTDERAWQCVADALDAGIPVEVIELQKPPGKKGYVLRLPGCPPVQTIYVKLQLGSDKVIGRSFHQDKLDN